MNPTLLLGGALGLCLSLIGGYFYGFDRGEESARVTYQAEQIKADRAAAKALADVIADRDDILRNHQAALVAASQAYQEDLKHEKDRKDRVIADLRAGAIRLRDPGTFYTPGANTMPGALAAAGGCDAAGRGQFSDQTAEFLIGLASECDSVARQLGRCQQVVQTYQQLKPKGATP